jgi:hypothetical protein
MRSGGGARDAAQELCRYAEMSEDPEDHGKAQITSGGGALATAGRRGLRNLASRTPRRSPNQGVTYAKSLQALV